MVAVMVLKVAPSGSHHHISCFLVLIINLSEIRLICRWYFGKLLMLCFVLDWDEAILNYRNKHILHYVDKKKNESVHVDLREHNIHESQIMESIIHHVSIQHSE